MSKKVKLMLGDNISSLKKLPDNSVDSVITDGPYGLTFMNKKWDYDVPSIDFWREVFRVLKPGGHVLSFGGTRTYHRMVVNIEDAGFEIRDQIMWLYGSGFPKSHNISKAIDKKYGRLGYDLTKSKTPEGQDWEGWGTALKPANEPICLARKPLSEKSVAENVLKWRTGGINVDGCRVGSDVRNNGSSLRDIRKGSLDAQISSQRERIQREDSIVEGRFPANIILECICDEVIKGEKGEIKRGGASRFFYQAKVSKKERNMGLDGFEDKEQTSIGSTYAGNQTTSKLGGNPDKPTEPKKNNHPTVKPINLMTYLCRLITPEGGVILDPFMGSGSTGIAALIEGFRFVGMELDEDYFKIAESRIENYEKYKKFVK